MNKIVTTTTDSGIRYPGDIAMAYYGENYILEYAGYDPNDPDDLSDEYCVIEDLCDAAVILERGLQYHLLRQVPTDTGDGDHEVMSVYAVRQTGAAVA